MRTQLVGKEKFIGKVLEYLEKRGYGDIRANIAEFDKPTSYTKKGDDKPFIPDVTGKLRGVKDYFEVALKTDTTRRTIAKWKLLGTLAEMKNGKLYLFAPYGHKAFAQKILDEHKIKAILLPIEL